MLKLSKVSEVMLIAGNLFLRELIFVFFFELALIRPDKERKGSNSGYGHTKETQW
jgi:hypothetical protein